MVPPLDLEGQKPQYPEEEPCGFKFYDYEEETSPLYIFSDLVAELESGFMVDTEEEEEEIRAEAEEVANDLVYELESLLG